MGLNRLLVLPCTVLFTSCSGSPSAPTEIPDIRGSWKGVPYSWNWTDTNTYDFTGSVGSVMCSGVLIITSQDASSFGGRYAIEDCSSDGSSGTVLNGHIAADGQLTFRLVAEEGWGPGLLSYWSDTDCRLSEDSGIYEGSLSNGTITAQRLQILACPPGRVTVQTTFRGTRE